MKVYLGTDHNGYQLKSILREYLQRAGYDVIDDGDEKLDPDDDYPVFAAKVVHSVLSDSDADARGILICGSGQGMCMAANRYKGIRACLGYDRESIIASRNDDDANILCLPAKVADKRESEVMVEAFLNTPFANAPRFVRRLQEIDAI